MQQGVSTDPLFGAVSHIRYRIRYSSVLRSLGSTWTIPRPSTATRAAARRYCGTDSHGLRTRHVPPRRLTKQPNPNESPGIHTTRSVGAASLRHCVTRSQLQAVPRRCRNGALSGCGSVAIYGSCRKSGRTGWSRPFAADHPAAPTATLKAPRDGAPSPLPRTTCNPSRSIA